MPSSGGAGEGVGGRPRGCGGDDAEPPPAAAKSRWGGGANAALHRPRPAATRAAKPAAR